MDDFKLDDVRADDPPGNDPRGNEPQMNELRADDRWNNDPQSSDLPLNELRKFMVGVVPYWQTLGLELMEVEPGRAVLKPSLGLSLCRTECSTEECWRRLRIQPAPWRRLRMYFRRIMPLPLQVAYLKPVVGGRFRAVGRCLKAGKSVFLVRPRCSIKIRRWYAARAPNCW
jgi:hypothetical protein